MNRIFYQVLRHDMLGGGNFPLDKGNDYEKMLSKALVEVLKEQVIDCARGYRNWPDDPKMQHQLFTFVDALNYYTNKVLKSSNNTIQIDLPAVSGYVKVWIE